MRIETKKTKMKTKSLTKATLLSIFIMSVVTAVTLNSCQKEVIKPKTTNTGLTSASNPLASSQVIMNEVNNMIFASSGKKQKGLGQTFNFSDTSGGVIVTIDTISKPHTMKYDYGTGCVGSDGKTRVGVAIISYDDQDIRTVNNVFSLTLQNYSITGFQGLTLNGAISYTNTGANGNGNLVIAETGGYVGTNGTVYDTVTVNYQYEWIAGESSSPLSNLQFKITGSMNASGTNNGQSITAVDSVTSPLIKNCRTVGCNYFIDGNKYTNVGGTNITLTNYGTPGGCSGQMAVTANGMTTIQNQ